MAVRRLAENDREAYAEFRSQMWPVYSGAGSWDNVRQKYSDNPLAQLCPDSGLYALFQGGKIGGVMGAYPMPITLNEEVHAGHMIVDWAVLPRLQRSPMAAILYRSLLDLPGRKFASSGSEQSQSALEGRGHKIYSTQTMAVLRPTQAALMKKFRVAQYASPCPLPRESFETPGVSRILADKEIVPPTPADRTNVAYVHRDSRYWDTFCRYRDQNGTAALGLTGKNAQLQVLLKVLEVGHFRMASLLGVSWVDAEGISAFACGKLLRQLLDHLDVAVLMAGEADSRICELLEGICPWKLFRRKQRVHWWVLPKPSDTFTHDDVSWWMTLADRDSIWGVLQPDTPQRLSRKLKASA